MRNTFSRFTTIVPDVVAINAPGSKGGECFAPHLAFPCERQVPQVSGTGQASFRLYIEALFALSISYGEISN